VADDHFDAIRSVESKRYQYSIWNTTDRNPHQFDMCWHRWEPLDAARMAEAAKLFVGEHDFASFARAKHGRYSSVRTVYSVTVSRRGPRIVIGVEGNGFLWHQVRIMVGTLVEIGVGKREPGEIIYMLSAFDRRAGGATAPLWLQWVRTGNVLRPAELDESMEEAAD
jgi:tRNA pseudouridine38-40 synthase